MSSSVLYDLLKKALTEPDTLQEISKDAKAALHRAGVSDPNEILQFQQILGLAVRGAASTGPDAEFLAQQLKSTSETADKFKQGLRATVDQIDAGFRSTMRMYQVAFYMGAALISLAAGLAIWGKSDFLAAVFGGLGILDFLGFFVTKPPRDLQASRARLAQIQAAYFNWFIDIFNWNSFLKTINQPTFEAVAQVSELLLNNTERTLRMVHKYCDMQDVAGSSASTSNDENAA